MGVVCGVGAARAEAAHGQSASAALLALGTLALALGMVVYTADRDPAGVALLPNLAALHTGPLFGVIGSWVPSFVHPFAFSLFTAVAAGASAAAAYRVCAGWWAVDVVFEVAQHPHVRPAIVQAMHDLNGSPWSRWLTQPLTNYLQAGTFDPCDLAAVTAGTLAAAGVVYFFIGRWSGPPVGPNLDAEPSDSPAGARADAESSRVRRCNRRR